MGPRKPPELVEQVPLPTVAGKLHAQGEQAIAQRIAGILRKRPDTRSDNACVVALILTQSIEAVSRWLVHHASGSLDKPQCVGEVAGMIGLLVARDR